MPKPIDTSFLNYLKIVRRVERTEAGVLLDVDEERVRIDVLRDDVVRIKVSQAGAFDETPTFAAIRDTAEPPAFKVKESANAVELTTARMKLRIDRASFAIDAWRADGTVICESARNAAGESEFYGFINNRFVVTRRCAAKDVFYGLGEKTGGLNRQGRDVVLWNTDIMDGNSNRQFLDLPPDHPRNDPTSTAYDPYYISIPFFYHMPIDCDDLRMAGFFVDNGYRGRFEFVHGSAYRYEFSGGQYTEYLFAGPAMKDILEGYTWITGRMQAPPLWALGYHQCRWYPYTQETFRALSRQFRERGIPCDVMWLDIDYMDGFRVFTWNRKIFSNVPGMLKDLKKEGFRLITIIDPGVKYEPGYKVFDEGRAENLFCRSDSGQTYIGRVWPGRTAFPDFVKPEARVWWGRLNAEHVRSGIAGIWNDMNEPATGCCDCMDMRFDRDGQNHPHERYHNQYGMLMAMGTVDGLRAARPEERTFVLSRAGFAGIQRYAANWMGDNMSRWEHLAMSIPMAMGLGISGQPFVGADVGGFGGPASEELLVRWMQYGALTPFFRNHNCDGKNQYPWAFGATAEELCRQAIALRYRLLPYVYTAFMRSAETGDPIQRPLVYDFQSDQAAACVDDQYLFGDALLVAPVCKPGETARRVYLPAGSWVDWHSGVAHAGCRYVVAPAPMEHIPLFVRGGSVVPMLAEAPRTTMGLRPESIDLHVFVPREDGTFRSCLHEDDGLTFAFQKGACLRTMFALARKGRTLRIEASVTGNGFPEFARQEFRLVSRGAEVGAVKAGARSLVRKDGAFVLRNDGKGFTVEATLR